ncbi:solute carrier family 49 member 4 homolog [Physella acuta]|uniref:solute carrier family 49 member 4 homolog n=1 Tax=Physella acuta TaxID=109671 RepID=UPI0027DB87E6|nr:solute carrier family 49 member 4 homolog [Physella acuta]
MTSNGNYEEYDYNQPLLSSKPSNNEDEPLERLYYDSISRVSPTPDPKVYPGEVREHPLVLPDSVDSNHNVEDTNSIRLYKRRWYVLILYSTYTCFQSTVWNTWGPISNSSEEAFGWTDETIAWLSNWGPLTYVIFGLFYPWLLHVKGIRWAVISSMFFVTLGAAFRVITSDPFPATILIHIGQFFCGVGGPVSMGSIPAISATWFPPKERVSATAISACINTLGVAVPFVVGPALVYTRPPNATKASMTFGKKHNDVMIDLSSLANVTERIKEERQEIMVYMYYQCGACVLLLLLFLIYFPEKPPHPPCPSAVVHRENYWTGLWSLRKKGHFILLSVIYGVSLGVLNNWSSVLNVNLDPFGIEEDEAGWIGFYATIGACVGTLVIGKFADHFARSMKLFILVTFLLGAACFVVFALVLIKVIPFSSAVLYVTVIGGNTLINAAVPIIYELGCELAYPTSEGAANGLLTLLNNLGGLIFLAIFFIPNVGTMWMNWTVIGSIIVCLPMIAVLKSRFNRLEVDEGVQTQPYLEQTYTIQA